MEIYTLNDKIREAFESSPLCAGAYLAMTNGHYVSATVNRMWRDWQASKSEFDGTLTSDGTNAQQVAVPVPLSDVIASMRAEMEMAEPLSDVYLDLLERLQSAVVEDIAASFALGNMPVYATGNGNHVAVHPSAQKPGMFQVSRYALDGIIGDSQYLKIIDLVRSEGLASYSRLDDSDAALVIGHAVEAEGKFETRKAQAVHKRQPLGWMIEGSSIVVKGDFAELDTKAEAKRIGGTCKAYPIYREPVLVDKEPVATVQCINGITIGYLDVMQPVGTKLYSAPVDIEALTKERDLLLLQIDVQAGSIGAVQDANQRLSKERDALMTARYAYATEFALDEDGEPDVGSIHQNIRALKAAAKLALSALEEYANPCNWEEDFQGTKRKWLEPDSNSRNQYGGYELAQNSVTALKKAGVAQ